jgi:stage III sporulation protein SpoIIIAA
MDYLFGGEHNILILGPPGTGKSSIIRDVTRILSESLLHVVAVDTSNELCGNGSILHPSIGMARRMMVPSLDEQRQVMIEAVQNHTPDIIVVDEIGRPQEVEAAATIKNRGVRLMATAHGTFRDLMHNPGLKNLLGGFERVILGDKEAKAHPQTGELQKTKTQRAGDPVFDVIVELAKDKVGTQMRIIHPVKEAVDSLLAGGSVKYQCRRFGPYRSLEVKWETD